MPSTNRWLVLDDKLEFRLFVLPRQHGHNRIKTLILVVPKKPKSAVPPKNGSTILVPESAETLFGYVCQHALK